MQARKILCERGNKNLNVVVTYVVLPYSVHKTTVQAGFPHYAQVYFDEAKNQLHGVFLWNPRQIWIDQFLLHNNQYSEDGIKDVSPELFTKFAYIYHQAITTETMPPKLEAEFSTIPEDVLWLFKESSQSTRSAFVGYAYGELMTLVSESEPGYSMLTAEIIKSSLEGGVKPKDYSLRDFRHSEILEVYKYKTKRR